MNDELGRICKEVIAVIFGVFSGWIEKIQEKPRLG
jgi:hypothetical protein